MFRSFVRRVSPCAQGAVQLFEQGLQAVVHRAQEHQVPLRFLQAFPEFCQLELCFHEFPVLDIQLFLMPVEPLADFFGQIFECLFQSVFAFRHMLLYLSYQLPLQGLAIFQRVGFLGDYESPALIGVKFYQS